MEESRKRVRSTDNTITDEKRSNTNKTPNKMDKPKPKDQTPKDAPEEPTLREVLTSMNKLHEKIDKHLDDFKNLQSLAVSLDEKVTNLEDTVERHTDNLSAINSETQDFHSDMASMKSIIIRQSEHIAKLQKQTLDLTARSMRDNLLFHNIPESKANGPEDCETRVQNALKEVGFCEHINFERIHRLGAFTSSSSQPRPIVGKIPYKQAEAILTTSRTRPRSEKNTFFVSRQIPQEIREKKKKMWEKAEEFKKKDSHCKTKITADGKLFVNGQLDKDSFQPPSVRDIMLVTDRAKLITSSPHLVHGKTIFEKGSSFAACVAKVRNADEARRAYTALLMNPDKAVACHNIGAYRLFNPATATTSERYCDDGEHGAGKVLTTFLTKKNLTNVAVFVSRGSDGTHLGKRRFQLLEEAVESALSKLALE